MRFLLIIQMSKMFSLQIHRRTHSASRVTLKYMLSVASPTILIEHFADTRQKNRLNIILEIILLRSLTLQITIHFQSLPNKLIQQFINQSIFQSYCRLMSLTLGPLTFGKIQNSQHLSINLSLDNTALFNRFNHLVYNINTVQINQSFNRLTD